MVYEWPISEGSYTGEAGLVYERPILEGSYTGEAVLVYERGRTIKKTVGDEPGGLSSCFRCTIKSSGTPRHG